MLLLPNVIDAALCARIIEAWRADHAEGTVRRRAGASGEAEGSTQTKVVDHRLKKRQDHRPDDALNQELTEAVTSEIVVVFVEPRESAYGYKPTWAGQVETEPRPPQLHALITPP